MGKINLDSKRTNVNFDLDKKREIASIGISRGTDFSQTVNDMLDFAIEFFKASKSNSNNSSLNKEIADNLNGCMLPFIQVVNEKFGNIEFLLSTLFYQLILTKDISLATRDVLMNYINHYKCKDFINGYMRYVEANSNGKK